MNKQQSNKITSLPIPKTCTIPSYCNKYAMKANEKYPHSIYPHCMAIVVDDNSYIVDDKPYILDETHRRHPFISSLSTLPCLPVSPKNTIISDETSLTPTYYPNDDPLPHLPSHNKSHSVSNSSSFNPTTLIPKNQFKSQLSRIPNFVKNRIPSSIPCRIPQFIVGNETGTDLNDGYSSDSSHSSDDEEEPIFIDLSKLHCDNRDKNDCDDTNDDDINSSEDSLTNICLNLLTIIDTMSVDGDMISDTDQK